MMMILTMIIDTQVLNNEITLTLAHLRIGYLVGNPGVGNPDPRQSLGLPTSIITLYKCCPCSIRPFGMWWGHVLCILAQYFEKGHFQIF